jgi:hypothetical protein
VRFAGASESDEQGDGRGREHGQAHVDPGEQASERGADHEADTVQGTQETEALGPLLGRCDVRGIGEEGGHVARRDALDDPAEQQHPDRAADSEDEVADHGAEGRDDDDRSAPDAIRQAAEERRGEERAERADALEHPDPDGQARAAGGEIALHDERHDGEDDRHADHAQHGERDEHDPGVSG